MGDEARWLEIEEGFWKGDAGFYRRHLTDDAIMVFPEPVGVLSRERTIEAIASAPRWASVRFEEPRIVRLRDDVAVVSYRATAAREGQDSPHTAFASSVYVRDDGAWKLAFHQQT
jgi:hypothetical protein